MKSIAGSHYDRYLVACNILLSAPSNAWFEVLKRLRKGVYVVTRATCRPPCCLQTTPNPYSRQVDDLSLAGLIPKGVVTLLVAHKLRALYSKSVLYPCIVQSIPSTRTWSLFSGSPPQDRLVVNRIDKLVRYDCLRAEFSPRTKVFRENRSCRFIRRR